jgi:hypothetical protein
MAAVPAEVFERLCDAANKPAERLIRFLHLTGRPTGEAVLARWDDIDLGRALWTIRPRGKKSMAVELVPEAIALLRSIREAPDTRAREANLAAAGLPMGPQPVFANVHGNPWTRPAFTHYVRKLMATLGTGAVGVRDVRTGAQSKLADVALSEDADDEPPGDPPSPQPLHRQLRGVGRRVNALRLSAKGLEPGEREELKRVVGDLAKLRRAVQALEAGLTVRRRR